ncbi:hypothetical protein TNCV_3031271 [Trichonephila clavipes]|nr:hypothetical protein TNCV_3031271 [Trichonephila clavipes]
MIVCPKNCYTVTPCEIATINAGSDRWPVRLQSVRWSSALRLNRDSCRNDTSPVYTQVPEVGKNQSTLFDVGSVVAF